MKRSEKKGWKLHIVRFDKRTNILLFTLLVVVMVAVIVVHHNPLAEPADEIAKKCIACGILTAVLIVFIKLYDKITVLPVELYQNRRLIWKLAKNDFKKRYAGSYLGAVWAMVQPVVTVAMYYVVFTFLMPSKATLVGEGVSVPYVLFLTAGLVPWFYFSEAIVNGTMALLEYDYLVKKVVFKISVLPIIKIIAATFIHAFFVCVMLIIAAVYGYYPSVYTLQIFYYAFCMFVLVLALSYTTCSVVIFFRDLSQIINILMQIGMWATPILWSIDRFQGTALEVVLKVNPLVYIVNGYRSAVWEHTWFFEDFYSTMYFWIITMVLFSIGALIFKRLKVHFADVM